MIQFMKKRLISIILAIAMLACMIPLGTLTAFAETAEVKYMDWDSSTKKLVEKTKSDYTLMTESTTSLADGGWYVVDGNVEVNVRIELATGGTAHIILKDDARLEASAGIEVGAGQSLYIYGQADGSGVLDAYNNEANFAGIGGSEETDAGTVTINGGTVIANGGEYSAGIGGGNSGNGGTVTINGGTVEAAGGEYGAGIGSGDGGNGGTVTINGGTVTAIGVGGGAGIGSGSGNGSNGGTVTINGGTVTAIGEDGGAGIGGGNCGNGGSVTINGGAVTATGAGGGVGIGGGDGCMYHGELSVSVNPALTIAAGEDEDLVAQTTLDDYLSLRNEYLSSLEEDLLEEIACIKVLDWSGLDDAYNTAYALVSDDYTDSSWNESGIEDAIDAAMDPHEQKSITNQEEINELTSLLTEAMEVLAKKANVSDLESALNDAENVDENDYETDENWGEFESAVEEGKTLWEDAENLSAEDSQEDVDNAAQAIRDAMDNLTPVLANYEEYDKAVTAAQAAYEHEELYTEDSFSGLLNIWSEFCELDRDIPIKQQDVVDTATNRINEILEGLKYKAISAADEITDSTAFTAESWAKFYMAKKAAKNIASGLDITHLEEITVAAEALAAATEGLAELSTAQYNMIYERQSDDWLMARQGKIIGGEVSDTIGRTIIPLTQEQIDSIGDYIWVVGFDGYKNVKVKVDCAYTWFYNVVGNETVKIEAGVTPGLENYAAFIIIDNDGTDNADKSITGFGYYRVYNGDDYEDTEFMLDALYLDPQLAKIPVELRNTAWSAPINDGSENYDAVLTIGLDSATLSFGGNDYTAPLGSSDDSQLIFVADSEIELTINYDNGTILLGDGGFVSGNIGVTTAGDIVKMIDAEE